MRRPRAAVAGLAFLAITAAALQQLPASAADSTTASRPGPAPADVSTIGDPVPGLDDLSLVGRVLPSAAQKSAGAALGDVQLRWNSYGTPASILPMGGSLGKATSGDAVASARAWLGANADLFSLPADTLKGLDLVGDQVLEGTDAHVVLLQQTFGGLEPARGSLVSVGVARGQITYVSSSLARTTGTMPAAKLSPVEGWLKAATDVGLATSKIKLADIVSTTLGKAAGGWTKLQVPGLSDQQMVRSRALAMADGSVRPVLQSNVLDGFSAFAYTVLVDAVDGTVLTRQNQVENAVSMADSPVNVVNGSFSQTSCGTSPIDIKDDATRTIVATVTAIPPALDDITLQLIAPGAAGQVLSSADVATSPEVLTYTAASIPKGVYTLKVCAYPGTSPTVGTYTGNVLLTNTAAPSAGSVLPDPKWRFFTANPRLDFSPTTNAQDNSVVGCWSKPAGCTAPNGTLESITSLGPWDTLSVAPTFTTSGNNALTREAWVNPLAPGGLLQAPISATRDYSSTAPPTSAGFTDAWNNSGCSPTNLVPGGNDINAVTGNLFVGHNQMHDWSYALGFTEKTYNLQAVNRDAAVGVAGDPEIGNVQAGALIPASDPTGGILPGLPVTGRDNANQIALMDGVPGITNQYLFQPLAGAFYSPCADGSLDTSIFGHEYTHAISNRMIGGPNDGITSEQGGAMGESWGDLNAGEYMFANDYVPGPNAWAVGPYATGNPVAGIRDYPINANPLNYSDYGFDTTGAEVHADGEIWNGTQWEVRDALATKWNAQFPYADKALQKRCSKSTGTSTPLAASACPGNRRWIQLIFEAFTLQQGDTDMLDARDAMIASDVMLFQGADVDTLWAAFARRGMGKDAVSSIKVPAPDDATATVDDVTEPIASFATPTGPNSTVTFSTTTGSLGKFYVGDYEARATPVADNDPATPLGNTLVLTPGRYTFTYVSPTNGFRRVQVDVPASGAATAVQVDDTGINLASVKSGARIIGATAGSLNPGNLIDGTEATTYGYVDTASTPAQVDVSHPKVAVDLAGDAPISIASVKVSALLSPAPADPNALPVLAGPLDKVDPDPTSGSPFTALRQFEIEYCVTDCANPGAQWKSAFVSADDAFPGDVPRPVAPNQTLRTFNFKQPVTASAVRLVTLENQCTGQIKYADASGQYTEGGKPSLDADPLNATDCKTGSDRGTIVHASELQVFGQVMAPDPVTPGVGVPGVTETGVGVPGSTLPTSPIVSGVSGVAAAKLLKTRTRIRLPRVQQVKGKESTKLKYAVVGIGGTSLGKVAGKAVVKIDGKKVKRKNVVITLKKGKKVVGYTFRIPKELGFGPHRIQVFYTSINKTLYTNSKSRKILLTVVRSRPRR